MRFTLDKHGRKVFEHEDYFRRRLPLGYSRKPKNEIFKEKDRRGYTFEVLITTSSRCSECGVVGADSLKRCTACEGSTFPVYTVSKCRYATGSCTVNRWGCSVHFQAQRSDTHPFTCCCDTCY